MLRRLFKRFMRKGNILFAVIFPTLLLGFYKFVRMQDIDTIDIVSAYAISFVVVFFIGVYPGKEKS